jgi:hypothetical protein
MSSYCEHLNFIHILTFAEPWQVSPGRVWHPYVAVVWNIVPINMLGYFTSALELYLFYIVIGCVTIVTLQVAYWLSSR